MVKQVVFPYSGMVPYRGTYIHGPVNTPFPMNTDAIFKLIIKKFDVYERLSDGSNLKLDIHNFDKDNTPVIDEVVVDPVIDEVPEENKIPAETVIAPVETQVEKEVPEEANTVAPDETPTVENSPEAEKIPEAVVDDAPVVKNNYNQGNRNNRR
ncbi:MAG: hypothetical protein PHF63_00630 [Herbinix sp.]|nr:hypothetical protein [Herbinix sp.]